MGSFGDSHGGHGFLYSNGVFTTLNVPGASITYAFGINNAGQIVGSYDDVNGVSHGFLYSNGDFTTIDAPGANGSGTAVFGINNSGQIVGSFTSGGTGYGFLDTNGSFTSYGVPGAYSTIPEGLNNSGQIVGWYDLGNGIANGFVENAPEPRSLLLLGSGLIALLASAKYRQSALSARDEKA